MKNYIVLEEMCFWNEEDTENEGYDTTVVAVCTDWDNVREAVKKAIRNLRLSAGDTNVVTESFDCISYITTSVPKRQVSVTFKVEEFNETNTLL